MAYAKGEVLGGRYRIEDVLGQGALSLVYAATCISAGDLPPNPAKPARVAIKVLDSGRGLIDKASERFMREAEVQLQVESDAVVRVFEVLQTPTGDPAIVMELIEGGDLALRLSGGSLGSHEVIALGLRVLSGLEAIHQLGVVHGDIKPSNIYLPATGDVAQAKLSDLGLAERVGFGGFTATGTVLGTPLYMSPEAVVGARRNVASDLWSLGVVLYECAYGRLPFGQGRASMGDLLSSVIRDEPSFPPLRFGLERVLQKALQKKAEERFPSATAFAAALSRCLEPASSAARAARLFGTVVTSALDHKRRVGGWLLVVGAAAGALVWERGGSRGPTSALRIVSPFVLGVCGALCVRAVIGLAERRRAHVQKRLQGATQAIRKADDGPQATAHSMAVAVESLLARTSGNPSIDLRQASLAFAIDDFRQAKDRGEQRSALDRAIEIADKLQEQIKNSAPPWYVRKKEAIAVIIAMIGAVTALVSKVVELRK